MVKFLNCISLLCTAALNLSSKIGHLRTSADIRVERDRPSLLVCGLISTEGVLSFGDQPFGRRFVFAAVAEAEGVHLNDGLASFVHATRTPVERVL
jgi:hypothetical protein